MKYDKNKIYTSNNSGDYIIIDYINHLKVGVKFLDTDYVGYYSHSSVKRGTIKDPTRPHVCGVGYIGKGQFNTKDVSYPYWNSMLRRCYNEKSLQKYPTYKDVAVCEEWLNYQNFAKWFNENYQEGYHLDKDIKVEGNKLYSPDTCMFVSAIDNSLCAQDKNMYWSRLIAPQGFLLDIYNKSIFCKKFHIRTSDLFSMITGRRKSCKGWTLMTRYLKEEEVGYELIL